MNSFARYFWIWINWTNNYFFYSGIKKVVIGSIDPNPKVSGKGIQILKENNVHVDVGIHQDLVAEQNKFFFYRHINNKPYITVKIASSLDGKSHYENHERVFAKTLSWFS